MMGDRL